MKRIVIVLLAFAWLSAPALARTSHGERSLRMLHHHLSHRDRALHRYRYRRRFYRQRSFRRVEARPIEEGARGVLASAGSWSAPTSELAKSSDLARMAQRYVGSRNPTGFRGPWCGAFLGMIAKRTGHAAPAGFRLARNWAHDGPRLRKPVPGSLMVMSHHVGVVLRVAGPEVLLVSGNHDRRVGVGWYSARSAIAFVSPS